MTTPKIHEFINSATLPILPLIHDLAPWEAVCSLESLIECLLPLLNPDDYHMQNQQAIHKTAHIEPTAQLKGALIIGPTCFVANGSLLRGGVILDADCIVGHCGELKTSIMLHGSKLAHLNFVGDSIVGAGVNIEGGAIIANYRNEWSDKEIRFYYQAELIKTGVQKFGALLGDHSRVGANAVIAPGAIFAPNSIIKRGAAIDQAATAN